MKALPFFLLVLLLTLSAGRAQESTFKSKVIDADDNSVTETIADSKGKILKKTTFYFDENNWSKSAIHYDLKGAVRYKEVYKRDDAGLMLVTWLYNQNDKFIGKRTFTYDGGSTVPNIQDFDAEGRPIARAVAAPKPARSRNQSRGKPDKKR